MKLYLNIINKKTWKYLSNSIFVATEHRFIINKIKKINTIIDVGANKGQFSAMLRILYPDAFIYSFEPLQAPFNRFSRTFKNDTRIRLYNYAIGSSNGEKVMHISKREDSSSLLPITEIQSQKFPGTEEIIQQEIKVSRLNNLIKIEDINKPCLMKIDVQGYELEVLKGSLEFLPIIDYIYAECSFVELYEGQSLAKDIISFLQKNNFYLEGVYNMQYDKNGIAVQGDFLFNNIGAN